MNIETNPLILNSYMEIVCCNCANWPECGAAYMDKLESCDVICPKFSQYQESEK